MGININTVATAAEEQTRQMQFIMLNATDKKYNSIKAMLNNHDGKGDDRLLSEARALYSAGYRQVNEISKHIVTKILQTLRDADLRNIYSDDTGELGYSAKDIWDTLNLIAKEYNVDL